MPEGMIPYRQGLWDDQTMRISTLALSAAVAAALLAGCGRKEERTPEPAPAPAPAPTPAPGPAAAADAAVTGFTHTGAFDLAGFYMPQAEVRVGNWKLEQLGVGSGSDFAQWEQGDRMSTFGPILLEFADTTSPMQTGETGAESHTVKVRVLPTGYATDGKTMKFAGTDPKLGQVTFEGAFDVAALSEAKAQGASEQTVLNGTLQVGDTRFANTRFSFYAGD
jgi:hypothetical protein